MWDVNVNSKYKQDQQKKKPSLLKVGYYITWL